MKANKIIEEIDKLEVSEKLLLVEDVWDSIAHNDLPLPEWQKRELGKRYEEYRSQELKLHDSADIHAELRTKYK